jgi:hypothetical protein
LSKWLYHGEEFVATPTEYQGFVYQIHDLMNDMYYIGKKNFWTTLKRPPLKGRVNKRHSKKPSDWETYYGSSERLTLMVKAFGTDNFTRQILVLCENKTMMSYWETKLQFDNNVLVRDDYYNEFISCRINKKGFRL